MSAIKIIRFITQHPLSHGRRLRNIARFVAWQLRSRLVPGATTFEFVNGARVYIRRGMTGITGNYYVGLDEFQDMAFLLHFLRPADLFVDVGANVGSYTLLAASAVGANVIAFEPGAAAREWLSRNVALNNVSNLVDLRDQAVGSRSGTAAFTKGLDTVNHLIPTDALDAASSATEAESEIVEITTLDDALVGKSPVMLKVDVEGFETEVIRSAAVTLANPTLQCVLLELGGAGAAYGYNEDDVRRCMRQFGFTLCSYQPFGRQLAPCGTDSVISNNSLFVRNVNHVVGRLVSAKPFLVLDELI